jgi:hypothetical protein
VRQTEPKPMGMVPAYGRLWWTGSALANHRAMSQRGLRLARSKVLPVRDPSQHFTGRRPPTRQYADLETRGSAETPVLQDAALFAARCI